MARAKEQGRGHQGSIQKDNRTKQPMEDSHRDYKYLVCSLSKRGVIRGLGVEKCHKLTPRFTRITQAAVMRIDSREGREKKYDFSM